MLHPSYTDLKKVIDETCESDDSNTVNSRYSVVMATAKRARQIVDGSQPLVDVEEGKKPLSAAVEELAQGKLKIVSNNDEE